MILQCLYSVGIHALLLGNIDVWITILEIIVFFFKYIIYYLFTRFFVSLSIAVCKHISCIYFDLLDRVLVLTPTFSFCLWLRRFLCLILVFKRYRPLLLCSVTVLVTYCYGNISFHDFYFAFTMCVLPLVIYPITDLWDKTLYLLPRVCFYDHTCMYFQWYTHRVMSFLDYRSCLAWNKRIYLGHKSNFFFLTTFYPHLNYLANCVWFLESHFSDTDNTSNLTVNCIGDDVAFCTIFWFTPWTTCSNMFLYQLSNSWCGPKAKTKCYQKWLKGGGEE